MWRARFGRGFGPVVRQTAKWEKLLYNKIYVSAIFPMRFGSSFKQIQAKGRSLAPIRNVGSATNTARVNKTSDFSACATDIFALILCKYKFGIPRRNFTFVLRCYVSYLTDFLRKVLTFYLMLSIKKNRTHFTGTSTLGVPNLDVQSVLP
jgi:hypothetical protein